MDTSLDSSSVARDRCHRIKRRILEDAPFEKTILYRVPNANGYGDIDDLAVDLCGQSELLALAADEDTRTQLIKYWVDEHA